jgi:soluble lytic murein transglycosylase
MLGDPGTALGFGRWRHDERPRAYSEAVERAARKHGLDPNLLFAVMRVESIFNRRIVSYAGAVGLMQIMPRTGHRIAQKLGVDAFDVTDLLKPELNVEFSAWYLASLLDRFYGSLPLAIASYNGGPHNVRLWMRAHNPDMPLDAFLERIPFEQTHRYVRRVLTHYAAYRAQQDLPMARLDVALPRQRPDKLAF